jgi:hypothetical protein
MPNRSQQHVVRASPRSASEALTWRFHRTRDRKWTWEKVSQPEGLTRCSSTPFDRYEDCVSDARVAGYRPMLAAHNLVTLSLVSNPDPIPAILDLDDESRWSGQERRSSVLRKTVLHPVVERGFDKSANRAELTPRNRTNQLRVDRRGAPVGRPRPAGSSKSKGNRA